MNCKTILLTVASIVLQLTNMSRAQITLTQKEEGIRGKSKLLNIESNSTQSKPYLSSSIAQEQFSIEITSLQNTITNFGAFGDPSISSTPSAEWPANSNNQYAFTGDLWVGAQLPNGNIAVTTTNVYGIIRPSEWIPQEAISTNGSPQVSVTQTRYNDLDESVPLHTSLGLDVAQETFAFKDENFIVHLLRIKNLGTKGTLKNVFVGIFYDFDISSSAAPQVYANDDMASYDADNNISYMFDGDDPNRPGNDTGEGGISSGYVGIKFLNLEPSNNIILFPGSGAIQFLTDEQRYALLSTRRFDSQVTQPRDYSILHSSGPFKLKPGNSISLTFVLGIGEGLNGLIATMNRVRSYSGSMQTLSEVLNESRNPSETIVPSLALSQNYPNPFNPSTTITFSLPNVGTRHVVSLRVYDVLGREVVTLVNEEMAAGSYEVTWDAKDQHGSPLTSGVYFYRLAAGSFVETKRMQLVR